MKKVNLNCVYGAMAPGINEIESEVAEQLVAAGYATFVESGDGVSVVTKDAYDALVVERDALVVERDALVVERDTLVAELGMAQAELEAAKDGKNNNPKK